MRSRSIWRMFLLALFLSSCATVEVAKQEGTIGDYRRQIASLSARLVEDPKDAAALRDLGVIYFQVKQYEDARTYLKQASDLEKKDGMTLFYYGMTLESLGENPAALGTYLNYTDLSTLSAYRNLMEGRYRALTRNIIQVQLQQRVADERNLSDIEMSEGTIAVFPFEYQGQDQKYKTIGLGLSELVLTDFGKVSQLKSVERLRIDALLSELKFSQSDKVDRSTAPRLGKLLTAGRLVSGSYNISANNTLRVDASLLNAVQKQYPEPTSKSDELDNFFRLEKDLVFAFLKDMGITLTKAEQEDIQKVPTKNLQAFIMYTMGLEKESQKDFGGAAVFFNQAVELDPQFEQAKTKAAASTALNTAGTQSKALSAAYSVQSPIGQDRVNLVDQRLQNLGGSVGTTFFPGDDHREAVEEAANAGAAVQDLPTPPPPPR